MGSLSTAPLVIEAAVTRFSPGEPYIDTEQTVADALECLEAGAAIVHHHHDLRLDANSSIEEMIDFARTLLARYPSAITYPDFLAGATVHEMVAHFAPMAAAGVLGFAPVDPGASFSGLLDDEGLPFGTNQVRFTFDDANVALEVASQCRVPITIGVFEPFNLRWALAQHAAGRLPLGSMVKLYFGGRYSIVNTGKRALNFGLPPTIEAVDAYASMLEGTGIPWSVGVMGDALLETPIARRALRRGGHLRVGIEDAGGMTDATNRDTVETAVALAQETGRPVVQGDEARAALGSAVSDVRF
jgi:3-keto-5-aminohexanoate cleavage enzyme